LAWAVGAVGQDAGQQPAAGAGAQSDQAAAGQKKTIKDPAEYNSYVGAIQMPDANQKAAALEDFLTRYPNTVVKDDALEQLMGAYQQLAASNPQQYAPKIADTANKILQVNPNNLSALAVSVFLDRSMVTGATDPKLQQMRAMSERGLQALQTAPKPEGMADADWTKRKTALGSIFHGGLGFAALQAQDYPTAQQHLKAAVEAQPDNYSDAYALAVADLQARPMVMEGLWYGARAAGLAPTPQAQQQIATWAQSRYRKFHGGDDGWPELLAAAKGSPTPPAGWAVTPAPTPAEFAAKLIQTKTVNQMTPDELELVLSSGNQDAATKVWAGLKGVPQQFQGKIIQVGSKTELLVAFSADAIEANRANVDLTMTGPIPASMMPQVGQMIPLQGTPVSYEVTPAQGNNPPTLMIKMDEGALLTAKKPATKPTPRRRPH
ncbi:MAG TPA: hypothetical protein VL382_10275, partial [Terriglobales bacterium]|nr:hypothetical protein [Terriglobales bacterium]